MEGVKQLDSGQASLQTPISRRASREISTELCRSSWRLDSVDRRARERTYRRSCRECLLIGPLFAVFMLLQHTHMSLASSYMIERVLKFEFLSKKFGNYSHTVADVHDAALFWEWFEMMMEETVAVQHDELGHALPRSEWGYITGYNKILGGIRLEQDRGSKTPCKHNPGEVCYGEDASTEAFGYPACGPGASDSCYHPQSYLGFVNLEDDEGFCLDNITGHFEMWLDTAEPWGVLKKRVEYLEDRHWIDKQTRAVVIELLLRNDQFEPLISEVVFRFRFDRTGYVHEKAEIETLSADPYSTGVELKVVLAATYVLLNAVIVVHVLLSWRARYRQKGSLLNSGRRVLYANATEMVSVMVAVAQIALWCVYTPAVGRMLQRLDGLQRPSSEPLHNRTDAHIWRDYHHEIADLEATMKRRVAMMKVMRELASATLVCLLARSFKVWEGIPAFAAVTRTLAISAARLGSVLLSAGTLLLLFAGAAMLNYGTQLEEFHTIQRAVQETATIAITGEPRVYDMMSAIDPVFAALWFWVLIAVMFMAVLNLVLGILVEAAAAAGSEAPIGLMQQLYLTFHCATLRSMVHKEKQDSMDPDRQEEPDPEARAATPDPQHTGSLAGGLAAGGSTTLLGGPAAGGSTTLLQQEEQRPQAPASVDRARPRTEDVGLILRQEEAFTFAPASIAAAKPRVESV